MSTIGLLAPSYWASYLINGDDSGLNAVEKLACDDWIKAQAIGYPVSCEDAGFCHYHDAAEFSLPADCQLYTFLLG